MLTLLKASTAAAGVAAATVTGIVFALPGHAGPGAAAGIAASGGAPAGSPLGTHHGHHVHRGHHGGGVLWSGLVTAGSYAGFPGGALAAQTSIGDCSQVPGSTASDYAIAFDTVSGRWSNQVPVDSGCASL